MGLFLALSMESIIAMFIKERARNNLGNSLIFLSLFSVRTVASLVMRLLNMNKNIYVSETSLFHARS